MNQRINVVAFKVLLLVQSVLVLSCYIIRRHVEGGDQAMAGLASFGTADTFLQEIGFTSGYPYL